MRKGRAIAPALLCLMLFSACASAGGGGMVICGNDEYTAYPDAVSQLLPAYEVRRAENQAFAYLEQGAVVEAFDAQAVSALEAGLARYWYPQYLATVVIAVDRDRTQAEIRGWRDLPGADAAVGFSESNINIHLLTAAMAYGLEGGAYTLDEAMGLLAELQAAKRLMRNSFRPPVVICYDYQAAALIRTGWNIEIVVPEEGTLTYEKGLLSNQPLDFAQDTGALFFAAGLRLIDGANDPALYGPAAYATAVRVTDFDHLNTVCQDITRNYRRSVLRVRLYTSADGREHQFAALLFMILVVVWTAAVIRRAMQKGVRRAALAIGAILLGWMAVRLLKYQLIFAAGLDRYLWYSFYLFMLALPLALLWLAWVIDQPDGTKLPGWIAIPGLVSAALAALVFTNDRHSWVFLLSEGGDYSYGAGYYIVMAACVAMTAAAVIIMLIKSRQSPRKGGFVYPIVLCGLLLAYSAGYLLRVPFVWESDMTMVAGLVTLFFMETALRSGIIPANTKYKPLFVHSPLAMQIVDSEGKIALSSGKQLRQDENVLHFAAPITGGTAKWQEDIGALNRLHREVEEYARRLLAANAMLAEEERIQRALEEENARTQLMTQLEAEIAAHTRKLTAMIENAESAARIVLLLCYIKRRCNLFFRERETRHREGEPRCSAGDPSLPADELAIYIDELAELAGYADVKIIATNQIKAPLDLRRATLFYDFFYNAADWAAGCRCPHMLAHLGPGQALRLLPSEDVRAFQLEDNLAAAIVLAEGTVTVKDLDDAVGISLTFPERGAAYV